MSATTREELLLRALKDLGDNELKEFKWYLQKSEVLERFPVIPKSRLDKADRTDTVDQMLQTYCENTLEGGPWWRAEAKARSEEVEQSLAFSFLFTPAFLQTEAFHEPWTLTPEPLGPLWTGCEDNEGEADERQVKI
ncbi:NACHT, LRR and PYD domains-containing protein 3-like isoform X1 [Lates japonicus]|uniref:NACHT, LRR and PYD domains-containing protein 3-like isoform X1 n=1 Tax=Lates japonicus TaxID=270547 RepID=A0AAD3R5S6_LATJO|nr:NACHT, LRR and PYD domains-containing protein 3-like isoform X1 [Lates japonicus]